MDNLNPIDSFIIYAHDKNSDTVINPVDIRNSAYKREPIVFQPPQPQLQKSKSMQNEQNEPRQKIRILSSSIISQNFNLEQERNNKIWNQSHQAIFSAVDYIEKAINKYNKEIPQFIQDEFMFKVTTNNFYEELQHVNKELNQKKRYIEKKQELESLFISIIYYLDRKEPQLNSQNYQYQQFLRATFQLKEQEFIFEKFKTY